MELGRPGMVFPAQLQPDRVLGHFPPILLVQPRYSETPAGAVRSCWHFPEDAHLLPGTGTECALQGTGRAVTTGPCGATGTPGVTERTRPAGNPTKSPPTPPTPLRAGAAASPVAGKLHPGTAPDPGRAVQSPDLAGLQGSPPKKP